MQALTDVWSRSRFLPTVLLLLILTLDVAQYRSGHRWNLVMSAVLDEPAHLATAALALIALVGSRTLSANTTFTFAALAASVVIDVDHLPLYAGVPYVAVDGGRPFTHSLMTVAVLLLFGVLAGTGKPLFFGAAVGVLFHFLRDVATGPLSLLWPFTPTDDRVPYGYYLATSLALTVVASLRYELGRRQEDLHNERTGLELDDETLRRSAGLSQVDPMGLVLRFGCGRGSDGCGEEP